MKKKIKYIIIYSSISVATLLSCKKLIQVDSPDTSINSANVYKTDATAAEVINTIYIKWSQSDLASGKLTSTSKLIGLYSDELSLVNSDQNLQAYFNNSLISNGISGYNFWQQTYPDIFVINSAIEGITNSNSLTATVKNHLLGEAKFLRAFSYFYLVNIYGDIPLVLNVDYKKNAILYRTPVRQVYLQIESDLIDAKLLLSETYLEADGVTSLQGTRRVRPNKSTASALLSRVYLYLENYKKAEEEASVVINNQLYDISDVPLEKVFLLDSKEAIWQLQPVNFGWNTEDAKAFVILQSQVNPVTSLTSSLIGSFESGDGRKSHWVGNIIKDGKQYFFPLKYKIATISSSVTEYSTIIRLAELYLIRSEARAKQGNLFGANSSISDLNIIRLRAGLNESKATNLTALLDAILKERKVELFTEWGHRFFDLKRTGKSDEVLSLKGTNWRTTDNLFPIPQSEIDLNPSLKGKQNPGYQ